MRIASDRPLSRTAWPTVRVLLVAGCRYAAAVLTGTVYAMECQITTAVLIPTCNKPPNMGGLAVTIPRNGASGRRSELLDFDGCAGGLEFALGVRGGVLPGGFQHHAGRTVDQLLGLS